MSRWTERALAFAAALLIFAVYLKTIYPGLFGMGDAAKFSFVGKILGTPHAPGYPMYVMVSHLFSYIPIDGSLAYRMNVLSALLGALAVYFCYFAARALEARPAVALSAALALGLGRSFWAKAQYAKGYTLTGMLVCAGILLLLRWSQSGKRSYFYGGVAVFAIAVGNHLIIIALVPALVLHALLTNARLALAPRTLLFAAAMLVVGFSQYSLIMVRTWQKAPFLEARANTLSELVDVMTARRYAYEIGAYQASDIASTRAPVVLGLVERELKWPGLILAAIGVFALARSRARDAVLCFGGAAGVILLTMNMSSDEDEGFLLSAFVLLWLLAAAGLEALWQGRRDNRRWMTAVALLVTIGVPASLVSANYAANDHHRRSFEIRYFNALFRMLPEKSAIVRDEYATNMMVDYKILGEDAAAGRDVKILNQVPEQVTAAFKSGYRVFLFKQARSELSKYDFRVRPVALKTEPFTEYLKTAREGFLVVVAATPVAAAGLMSDPKAWSSIGVPEDHVFRRSGAPYAVIGVGGVKSGALEAANPPGATEADVSLASGATVGATTATAPVDIRAYADGGSAVISVEGKELVRSKDGAVAAMIGPRGVIESFALDPADGFRVPMEMSFMPLYELTEAGTCVNLGNVGWRDVSGVPINGRLTIRVDNYRPFLTRSVFYVVGDVPAIPALTNEQGQGTPALTVRSFRPAVAADAAALARSLSTDQLALPLIAGAKSVSRVEVSVDDNGDYKSAVLAFGFAPAQTLARITVDRDADRRATVCGASSGS
jgi:hypothetical protein